MSRFQSSWSQPQGPGLGERINHAVRPQGPLKPRVEQAIGRLQKQTARLDAMLAKLKEKDAAIFEKIVAATQQHDAHTGRVLSAELAEMRKVMRVLSNARVALEQMELRLSTTHTLGDTVATIMPTVGVMKSMKTSLAKFMPGADQELGRMTEMMSGMVTDTFSNTFSGEASFGADGVQSEESAKILEEAAALAGGSLGDRLPPTPAEVGEQAQAQNKFM